MPKVNYFNIILSRSIDHNIIYNAYRGVATTGWRGHSIFTDDATHHTMVTNNVIYDENAVSVNAGTMMKSISNYVANNVFDIGYAYNGAANIGPYIEPSGGMAFKNNIVYSNTGGTLHNNGTWSEDGAGDRVLLKFDDGSYNVSGTAALDSLSVMDNNLYFNAKGKAEFEVLGSKLSLSDWKQSSKNKHKYDQNSIMEDPQFVDAQNRDYRLKADSPAMAIIWVGGLLLPQVHTPSSTTASWDSLLFYHKKIPDRLYNFLPYIMLVS